MVVVVVLILLIGQHCFMSLTSSSTSNGIHHQSKYITEHLDK